jgi:hypothetical protein
MLAYDQLLGEGIRRRGRARERWRRSGVLLGYGPLSKRETGEASSGSPGARLNFAPVRPAERSG